MSGEQTIYRVSINGVFGGEHRRRAGIVVPADGGYEGPLDKEQLAAINADPQLDVRKATDAAEQTPNDENSKNLIERAQEEARALSERSTADSKAQLEAAQTQADEIVAAAEKQAAERTEKAESDAKARVEAAEKQATAIVEKANKEAEAIKAKASEQK